MASELWQAGADVEYKTLDRGVGAWAVKKGPDAIAPIPAVPGTTTVSENFEGTPWSTITFGGGTWALATDQSHSPTHSFKSATIPNNATTQFTMYNDTFDPQLSMWVKTNTESGFDFFTVKVDSVTLYQESGNNDWHRIAVPLNFGYQIDVIYSKDFSSAPVGDACWVDDIVFGGLDTPAVPGSPAHPLVYAPMHLTDDGIRLKTDVAFTAPQHVIVDSIPEVEIKNDSGSPVPISGTVTITDGSGPVTVDGIVTANQGTSPWVVSGTVNIGTIPEVEIKNDSGSPVPVNGTVAATQSGTWTTGRTWDTGFATDQVDASGSVVALDATTLAALETITTVFQTGTLTNGAQVSTAGAGQVSILALNANRKTATVQNVSVATVRIGVTGVTTTTGYRLQPGDVLVLRMPYVPTQELFMIREGAVNGTVCVVETT